MTNKDNNVLKIISFIIMYVIYVMLYIKIMLLFISNIK